jgi:hypothetical protein
MPDPTTEVEQLQIPREQAVAELEAVLRSPSFERSERLQRFLRFVCDLTLKGEGSRINEYLIGSEVFQRGSGYSPNEDSIVRRQAHTLRQKLNEFYSAEGKNHDVRIELPVGRYVPVFRRVAPVAEPLPLSVATPVPAAPSTVAEPGAVETVSASDAPPHLEVARLRISRNIVVWVGAVALFLAGVTFGWLLRGERGTTRAGLQGAATREIWAPWVSEGTDPVICFSNPLTAVIKHFNEPLPPDAVPRRFRVHPADEAIYREKFKLPAGSYVYYTPVINQTKMGEAIAGIHLASLLTKGGVQVRSTQSRFLSWDDLSKDNLIILGHNEANPWMEPLLKDYPFRLVATSGARQRGIVNTSPAPGELAEYKINYSEADTDADEEYALISMIPGVAEGKKLLLINGLNTQATQMATEFVTNERTLSQLLDRMKQAAPKHSGQWHFQAVLKTEVYDRVPTKATLVALRVF